ncbi:glycosyltransferase family 4 protein [Raineyella sp. LH-20]|uniref:glycosyltransferase family 4 protein n=1 Tax=Raineyella sp. LH-20 TaxID=3081204 RepID=UPI0029544782|nr:glycosyltransferase family 4 protein [Raineyella sp. LH-20]WOP17212.1 glycosyltransferase family 4 protein [Raineyella sp. LH-20]
MNIVFVLPVGEYYSQEWTGAIATITRHLARELDLLGHRATVLTPDDGGTLYAEGSPRRLAYGPAHPVSTLGRATSGLLARADRSAGSGAHRRYLRAVTRRLAELPGPVDAVVVANDPRAAAHLAHRRVGDRTLLWLHNRLEGAEAEPFRDLPAEVGVVAVSAAVAAWTRDRYLPQREIRVIHSGVDLRQFAPRTDWLDPRDPVRIVCHGRIDPNKGHEAAAEAVRLLREEGLPVEFTLIGQVRTFGFSREAEEAYRRQLEAAVAAAHGTRKGWLPHATLAEELRTHDIACVLSRVDEPFGLVNLEAMASGCAIVATRRGGIPEAVGTAGAFVDADAPRQVADAIRHWVRHRDSLAAAKRDARRQAERFPWSATAADLIELLRPGTR